MNKKAVFDLDGANCAGCVFAIEHLGRKIDGIEDVFVDAAAKKIVVDYSGNDSVLSGISAIVGRLGYRAEMEEAPSSQYPEGRTKIGGVKT